MPLALHHLSQQVAAAATHGVFIGTSSWKYPGWLGQLYTPQRYEYRGKVAKTRFERDCLAEYAETFRTVCVDAGYYAFPKPEALERMAAQTPPEFLFTFKVTDEITLKRFPNLPRFGPRAGRANPHFLDAGLFATEFLGPCQAIRDQIGVLIFEFSQFYTADFEHGRDFVAALDSFLEALPRGWRYGVEIRNQAFLRQEYFATLARHQVTHVFNSWSRMPAIGEQWAIPDSLTTPDVVAARFLLKPGRVYEEAVKAFSPYDEVKEPLPEAREAGAAMVAEGKKKAKRKTFIYVNNRLEGNALATIAAILEAADRAAAV